MKQTFFEKNVLCCLEATPRRDVVVATKRRNTGRQTKNTFSVQSMNVCMNVFRRRR